MATIPNLNTPTDNSCDVLLATHGKCQISTPCSRSLLKNSRALKTQNDSKGAFTGNSTIPLVPNSDVTGIGVIISFIVSAYVTLACAIFCYTFNLLPKHVLNTYDTKFAKRSENPHPVARAFFDTLAKGVLAASDTQILQGIAILVSAFINYESLTVFDWQIIVYLAWMSSNVHLSTLLFLQDYLQRQ